MSTTDRSITKGNASGGGAVEDPRLAARRAGSEHASGQQDGRRDRIIVRELDAIAADFEDYFTNQVVPHIDRSPTAFGVIENIRIFKGNHTNTATDFWLFLGGLVGGNGGVVAQISQRFSLKVDDLGNYREIGRWDLRPVGASK
jgi:hypothetical protein